jgi:hypothetical protein
VAKGKEEISLLYSDGRIGVAPSKFILDAGLSIALSLFNLLLVLGIT